MFSNQKLILLLSLIVLSLSVELEDEFDRRKEEEPKLIGVTQGIKGKKKQEIGLIFQNSKLSPKGLQSLYIREKENKKLYIIPLLCKNTMPYAKNIMDIFCLADLETPNVEGGNYIIECIKYKNYFFIDDKTQLEVEDSHDIELIGIKEVIFYYTQVGFYFKNKEYVDPKLLKLLKFAKDGKEYELTLSSCHNSSQYDFVFCYDSWPKLEIGKYEVEYIIYNNEIMKPKNPLYFNYVTERTDIVHIYKNIKRKKREEVCIQFYEIFNDPIEFYFREKDHSYILYKIYSEPYRKWDTVPYGAYSYEYYATFYLDTENIPKGSYKLEYVHQELRKNTNFTFELTD